MLTPREKQVLILLSDGRRNRGIAVELGLSERTVAEHIAAAVTRVGAKTREQAIALAIRGGEI